MSRISLDTETLGITAGSMIAQIAAVDIDNPSIFFNVYLDISTQAALGLNLDKSTVDWWNLQDPAIKAKVFGGSASLSPSLTRLSIWLQQFDTPEIWMNSPDFDSGKILAPAYAACGQTIPWAYYQERDFRTAKALGASYLNLHYQKPIGAHDALVDAKQQGEYIYAITTRLKSIGTNIS